jgi:hypothetical protein
MENLDTFVSHYLLPIFEEFKKDYSLKNECQYWEDKVIEAYKEYKLSLTSK